ncbi:hypothetical protein K439DRAFT_891500 [Ramaria rubella]|nr:hypothetical protein K439DRAFT_891500 [Ramaria rubella]
MPHFSIRSPYPNPLPSGHFLQVFVSCLEILATTASSVRMSLIEPTSVQMRLASPDSQSTHISFNDSTYPSYFSSLSPPGTEQVADGGTRRNGGTASLYLLFRRSHFMFLMQTLAVDGYLSPISRRASTLTSHLTSDNDHLAYVLARRRGDPVRLYLSQLQLKLDCQLMIRRSLKTVYNDIHTGQVEVSTLFIQF